tara:strand:- start:33553 stop:35124 length:1572 start_codon:yes stop_codon:yes gene_type:complete
MKRKASEFEVEESEQLKNFKTNQKELASRDFKESNIEELIESIKSSQLIFLGDFHTFDQQSKNLERLLRTLMEKKEKLLLGVEFVNQNKQDAIDQFSNQTITAMEFLEMVNYSESWRFPWHVYKPFFEMARKGEVEIFALNTVGSLEERDANAALKIRQILEDNPDAKLLVFFGELHITPNKLPQRVKELCPDSTQTIIHQNLDEVYWKLKDHGDQVVKFAEGEFSLQTSPPWVKYESMVYWFENLCEDPDFDLNQYLMGSGNMSLNSNVPENFYFLAEELSRSLILTVDEEELEDFNLTDHNQISLVLEKIEKLESTELKDFYKTLIARGKSFHLPGTNLLYCSNYSMNRLSYLAGIHLFETIQKRESNPQLSFEDKSLFFLRFCQQNLIGYFSSKLINPYRKCDMYSNFKQSLELVDLSFKERKNAELFMEILDSKDDLNKLQELLNEQDSITLFYVGRFLGKFLGEVLYMRIFNEKKLLKRYEELKERLFMSQANLENFLAFTNLILPGESYKDLRKRSF